MPGGVMKKRHLFLSLLLIMGCSDKKSEEEAHSLDRIAQESKVEVGAPGALEIESEVFMR
jgi:hypothetical protein